MDPPLGFLLKLPPAMIVVPLVVTVLYLVVLILGLVAIWKGMNFGFYKYKKDKDNQEKFKKSAKLTFWIALAGLIVTTLVDFLFVNGLPPKWWPESGNNDDL